MYKIARNLIESQAFTRHLGIKITKLEQNKACLTLPYDAFLGEERINGGAIASLIDLSATCAFWCHPDLSSKSRGATISLNINFMKLVRKSDIFAAAAVERRGSNLCVGSVTVRTSNDEKVAMAIATYKLNI